jgi:hypothetical protein
VETGPQPNERRIERVRFEMDHHIVVGDVMLPPDGYQSRFSDSMNRPDTPFLAVVNADVTPLEGGETVRRDFLVIGKKHVRLAFPVEEAPAPPPVPPAEPQAY